MTENKQQRRLLLLYTTIQGSSSFFNLEIYSRRSAASHFFNRPCLPCLHLHFIHVFHYLHGRTWLVMEKWLGAHRSLSSLLFQNSCVTKTRKERDNTFSFIVGLVRLVGDLLGKVEICKSYISRTKSHYSFIPNKSEKDKIENDIYMK